MVTARLCNLDQFNIFFEFSSDDFQINPGACQERGCIWDSTGRAPGVPGCYIDPEKVGYHLNGGVKKRTDGLEADLKLKETAKTLLKSGPQIEELKLTVDYLTDKILRLKIFDPKNARYEVPIGFDLVEKGSKQTDESKRKYTVDITDNSKTGFQISIVRKDTKSKM